uniref:NADH dehydrogenase subunit 6 n=1 Tax=Monodontina vondembuschiana TaxID=2508272 RepID=A0A513X0I7_9BIVA|nr:NADH dehydrogenase subunit 6 [Monodontina vondembuschiana]
MFLSASISLLCMSILSCHPLTLTIKVLILATSLCLTLTHTTTWYAYMLFMVTVGGMLVMFTYISSMAPNSLFSLGWQSLSLLIFLALSLTLTHSTITIPKTMNTQNQTTTPDNFISFYMSEENMSLLLTLASTLFLSMTIVTFLLSNSKTPMRQSTLLSSNTMFTLK